MKYYLPVALTTLRLLLGPCALGCALLGANGWWYLPILLAGTLSDIFDGILARRWGVATPGLRRYDSTADVIYHLFIVAAAWIACRPVIERTWSWIAAILASEALVIAVGFARFGRYPAAHSWLAKLFGLCLLGGLIALLVFHAGDWSVITLAIIGLLSNAETIGIHLLAQEPPVDVKSIFAVRRAGK
jgi:CDP-diacylglycerol--glycerol-3-phosphate 3-phosphatidyltransferase